MSRMVNQIEETNFSPCFLALRDGRPVLVSGLGLGGGLVGVLTTIAVFSLSGSHSGSKILLKL